LAVVHANGAKLARIASEFPFKNRAAAESWDFDSPVNKNFFLLASIILVGSAVQSSARPSAGGGGDPTKPPSEVSK
jgi:hypothetical protein